MNKTRKNPATQRRSLKRYITRPKKLIQTFQYSSVTCPPNIDPDVKLQENSSTLSVFINYGLQEEICPIDFYE